jgi:hypothetical protein
MKIKMLVVECVLYPESDSGMEGTEVRGAYGIQPFFESGEGYGAHVYKVEAHVAPDENWAPEFICTVPALSDTPTAAIARARKEIFKQVTQAMDYAAIERFVQDVTL